MLSGKEGSNFPLHGPNPILYPEPSQTPENVRFIYFVLQ